MQTGLEIAAAYAGYGGSQVLDGVSLTGAPGQAIGIVGPNGAGKSTLLRCISGLVPLQSGEIVVGDASVRGTTPDRLARAGLIHVPEGRRMFAGLTVREHLLLGRRAARGRSGDTPQEAMAKVVEVFPRLGERVGQQAQTLSGGEQQMLAIARGLMGEPRVLLIDEPTMGLAPVLVSALVEHLVEIRRTWEMVLVVCEQSAAQIATAVDTLYLLDRGRLVAHPPLSDTGSDLFSAYRLSSIPTERGECPLPTTRRNP